MLRVDECGTVDLPEQFKGTQATELDGDWWKRQIKVPV
jgi:hypothetical protein